MRRLLILLLTAGIFSTALFAQSKIITSSDFSSITPLLQKDTLLVMDDDDTLTTPLCREKTCQYLGGSAWYTWQSGLSKNNPDRIWKTIPQLLVINNLIFAVTKSVLTDPAIPVVLTKANQQGVFTLVLTARGYQMIAATEKQLQADNILALIEKNALIISSNNNISLPGFYLPTPWDKKPVRKVAYTDGIFYAAGQNKGVMLQELLSKTAQKNQIHHIIFIDDTYQNDVDMANAYKNDSNVDVTCIYFTRLTARQNAFISGKNAKALQKTANSEWYRIQHALSQNLIGFDL